MSSGDELVSIWELCAIPLNEDLVILSKSIIKSSKACKIFIARVIAEIRPTDDKLMLVD